MTYKATLKVQFDSEWTSTNYSSGFDDTVLPEEHYTFQVPAEDLNIYQLFRFFATVARAMVTQYGMTEKLGAVRYGTSGGDVFLGRDIGHQRD
jgi:ATP-dependent Zn protease